MTLVSLLVEKAAQNPDRTAIIEASGQSINYRELAHRSAITAGALQKRGIIFGDRVLVAVWPSIDLYITLAALWRIGAVAVFPEAATGLRGLRHAARTTAPKALIAEKKVRLFRPFFAELRAIDEVMAPTIKVDHVFDGDCAKNTSPALISFTSGTSGVPKAIQRNHDLLLAQHHALTPTLGSIAEQRDLVAFPAIALCCLGHGHTVVLPNWNMKRHDRADIVDIAKWAEKHQVTRFIVPPVIVGNLAGYSTYDITFQSLKEIITGGGPLFPDIMQKIIKKYPRIKLHILYGSTEAEPISHLNTDMLDETDWHHAFSGGGLPVGEPCSQATVVIGENHEILVAGLHVNESYMDKKQDKETKLLIDGRIFHRTGDMGRFDKRGKLWLLGRAESLQNEFLPFTLEIEARMQSNVNSAAALQVNNKTILVLTGELPEKESEFCQSMARQNITLLLIKKMPFDRRHRSKIDYVRLRKKMMKHKFD